MKPSPLALIPALALLLASCSEGGGSGGETQAPNTTLQIPSILDQPVPASDELESFQPLTVTGEDSLVALEVKAWGKAWEESGYPSISISGSASTHGGEKMPARTLVVTVLNPDSSAILFTPEPGLQYEVAKSPAKAKKLPPVRMQPRNLQWVMPLEADRRGSQDWEVMLPHPWLPALHGPASMSAVLVKVELLEGQGSRYNPVQDPSPNPKVAGTAIATQIYQLEFAPVPCVLRRLTVRKVALLATANYQSELMDHGIDLRWSLHRKDWRLSRSAQVLKNTTTGSFQEWPVDLWLPTSVHEYRLTLWDSDSFLAGGSDSLESLVIRIDSTTIGKGMQVARSSKAEVEWSVD